MEILRAPEASAWEAFLRAQPWSPFLQSFTMGEVYRATGQEPIRLALTEGGTILGICQAIVVPARRGKHLSVPYGPVLGLGARDWGLGLRLLVEALKEVAHEKECAFIRMSPFWCLDTRRRVIPSSPSVSEGVSRDSAGATRHDTVDLLRTLGFRPSPLHLLAEHIWYLDLRGKSPEQILAGMRSTTRNLIRRAEKEGVTVRASDDPVRDLPFFLMLHEETRRRHRFTPYMGAFFQAQVREFAPRGECALYLAEYRGEIIASSIHMIYGKETSYHHGASTLRYPKVPASSLLQWRAIEDALRRGDRVYNFWGIAPMRSEVSSRAKTRDDPACHGSRFDSAQRDKLTMTRRHPFAGVTTFKTGFGGELLEIVHCMDLPLSKRYFLTFGIERWRKWRRGF